MGKLRVFISSTMKDLVNERRSVVMRLREFNQEPVNAESWLPNGSRTWARIAQEIGSSDLFVLILGERYGWVPDRGPRAETGRSVTHLEFDEARRQGLPILVFAKTLSYDADRTSEDARRRDAFREHVLSWEAGAVATTFDDAFDLGPKVGQAVIDLVTDEYQRSRIAGRASAARSAEASLVAQGSDATTPVTAVPSLPPRLVEAVADRTAVLFAGSGVSLAAGLPSAAAFAQSLVKRVQQYAPSYEANSVGSALAGIASDVENLPDGRRGLLAAVQQLVHPPQGLQPTGAHAAAVRLFDTIVTTNYDTLFEQAAAASGRPFTVISNEMQTDASSPMIVNLHGQCSMSDLGSLVLTERDVLLLDRDRPRLWSMTRQLLATRPVVVLGSSLRDPSVVRLFTEALPDVCGYFVAPVFWPTTARRVGAWNLECIQTDAAGLFRALSDAGVADGPSAGRGH